MNQPEISQQDHKQQGDLKIEAKRSGGVPAIVIIATLLAVLGGLGWLLYSQLSGSWKNEPSTTNTALNTVTDNQAPKSAAQPAAQAPLVDDGAPKDLSFAALGELFGAVAGKHMGALGMSPEMPTGFPEQEGLGDAQQMPDLDMPEGMQHVLSLGNIAVSTESNMLSVKNEAGELFSFIVGSAENTWSAIVLDPYIELENSAELPKNSGLLNLLGENGKLRAPGFDDLKQFSFFTAQPTTIGFVQGEYWDSAGVAQTTLYLVDTESAKSVTIQTQGRAMPHWIGRDVYPQTFPPSYAEMHLVNLGDSSKELSASVVSQVKVYSDTSYNDDPSALSGILGQELSKAKLSASDLETLSSTDISALPQESISDQARASIQKFIGLVYYAKLLNKLESVKVLLERVHPTIKADVLASSELSVESGVSADNELALTDETQGSAVEGGVVEDKAVEPKTLEESMPAAPPVSADKQFEEGRKAANRSEFSKALRLWTPLAENGYAKAQTALGRMYARGDGVKRDFSQSAKWFQMAAQQGDDVALLGLGKMYMNGDGVKRDLDRAAQYFRQSVANGNREAAGFLVQLGR